MQPTGLTSLAAIVAAPPPQASDAASASNADDSAHGQQFSQLLNDSGTQSNGQQSGQHAATTKVLQAAAAASNALSAQEVTTPAEQIAQLLAQREHMVSPDDAKDLMKSVDKIAAQTTDSTDTQALAQVKAQLQDIVNSGTPKSVGAILDGAPALKDAQLSMVGLTALLTTKKPTTDETHADDQETAGNQEESSVAVAQAASMTVFRPDAGKNKADAPAAKSDTKKEVVKKDGDTKATTETVKKADTADIKDAQDIQDASSAANNVTNATTPIVTVLVPLAATFTQVAAATNSTNAATSSDSSDISIKDNMTPSALKPRSDLDQVVPPLTSDEGDDVLPEVNLPKTGAAADAASTGATSAASNAAAAVKAGDAKQADAVATDKAQANANTFNNLVQPAGSTPTQTLNAVQPVAVVQTPGVVNHAPVTDQVSVAVSKAAKDGISDITIQLDPAGLGRVEVNMHTNHDGQTQITFTVDKADTFDNLSRDARSLERSLQDAGVKADTGSMQFNMRQQPQPQFHSGMNDGQGQRSQQQANAQEDTTKSSTSVASVSPATITRNYIVNVREGVDISA